MMLRLNSPFVPFLALLVFALASPLSMADGKGWMIGGGVYYSDVDDLSGADFDNIELEDITFGGNSVAYNIQGGYRFNKWLSLDAGYADLGNFDTRSRVSGADDEFDITALTAGGMFSVPLWVLDLYGRLGLAMWDYDGALIDTDGTDAYYGLGVALNLGSSLDLYAEWVQYDFESKLDTLGLGIRFTF